MWNWLISSLAVGATVFLYDGNPLYPEPLRMFELIEKYKISIFGTSASYLHHLMGIEAKPAEKYDLRLLREISQTASTLSPEGFEYVYNEIKKDLFFNSISGGTDINGCFACALPIQSVYSGEVQGKSLGMKVHAYNDNAEPILDEQAELICEAPSPSMPIYFWGDDENMTKYKAAYFDHFKDKGKNVWRHGDYIVIHSDTGGITFWGRSDAVLKPSGVRIGTAEIYNVVEQLLEISDSLVIGQKHEGDIRIIMFVLSVVPSMRAAGMILGQIETSPLAQDNFRHTARKTLKILFSIYVGLTLLETISLLFCGMNFFDAITHSFATIATGGFSTKNIGIAHYNSVPIEIVIIIFMILSGIHFGLLFTAIFERSKNISGATNQE